MRLKSGVQAAPGTWGYDPAFKSEMSEHHLARAKALEAQGKSIVSLSIGQPDFQTPAHIVEAAIKALRDGHHGYTPANGIPQVREAVANDLNRRHGVTVDPANVLIVPGGKVTMYFACGSSSNHGDHRLNNANPFTRVNTVARGALTTIERWSTICAKKWPG